MGADDILFSILRSTEHRFLSWQKHVVLDKYTSLFIWEDRKYTLMFSETAKMLTIFIEDSEGSSKLVAQFNLSLKSFFQLFIQIRKQFPSTDETTINLSNESELKVFSSDIIHLLVEST